MICYCTSFILTCIIIGKRILDSIAETFSPKSPTRSPTKSPLREDNSGDYSEKGNKVGSRENGCSEGQETEKKRGRGRHKLYKEDTYISEPFESTGDFLVINQINYCKLMEKIKYYVVTCLNEFVVHEGIKTDKGR